MTVPVSRCSLKLIVFMGSIQGNTVHYTHPILTFHFWFLLLSNMVCTCTCNQSLKLYIPLMMAAVYTGMRVQHYCMAEIFRVMQMFVFFVPTKKKQK